MVKENQGDLYSRLDDDDDDGIGEKTDSCLSQGY